jgi:hypothetical protein
MFLNFKLSQTLAYKNNKGQNDPQPKILNNQVKHHFEAKPNSENEHHFEAHLAIEVLNKIPAEIADDYHSLEELPLSDKGTVEVQLSLALRH